MSTAASETPAVMDGFPPSAESQVTKKNQRAWPYSQWAFQNFGAPNNTVMVPRAGEIHHFARDESRLSSFDVDGKSLAEVFEANAALEANLVRRETELEREAEALRAKEAAQLSAFIPILVAKERKLEALEKEAVENDVPFDGL